MGGQRGGGLIATALLAAVGSVGVSIGVVTLTTLVDAVGVFIERMPVVAGMIGGRGCCGRVVLVMIIAVSRDKGIAVDTGVCAVASLALGPSWGDDHGQGQGSQPK